MPDRFDPTIPRHIDEAISAVNGFRVCEEELFKITGHWASQVNDPELVVHLFTASNQHASRAQMWADRLDPSLASQRPDPSQLPRRPHWLERPPAPEVFELLRAVDPTSGPHDELVCLVTLYDLVVPALSTSYRLHLKHSTAVSDAPVIRTLRLVICDLDDQQRGGETLVARLPPGKRAELLSEGRRRLGVESGTDRALLF
jgi:hypothetical protein